MGVVGMTGVDTVRMLSLGDGCRRLLERRIQRTLG